ncbi:glycosyltransferase family 2 protein [Halovulum sp. GXIMD14794]
MRDRALSVLAGEYNPVPNDPSVNIAIPTFNRADLLRLSLHSALSQDYSNFRITIIDNASSDTTDAVVRSFPGERVTHIRNNENIGQFRNWNKALSLNDSDFVMILQDDDIIHESFVSKSVRALVDRPEAAFSFSDASEIDIAGDVIANQRNCDRIPPGLLQGDDYLESIVSGENLVVHMSSVMLRRSALEAIGVFDTPHSRTSIDFNLFFRLASKFDLTFVAENLVQIRRHEGAYHRRAEVDTRPLAMLGERLDAGAYLLKSNKANDRRFRDWLCERLVHLNLRRSEMMSQMLPDLNLAEEEKRLIAEAEIRALDPLDGPAIIVDDGAFGSLSLAGRRALPFLEKDGSFWGPPDTDEVAIRELERMREGGARFMIFVWPAFWWYDFYRGLRDHLFERYRCLTNNSRLIVFDLGG